MHLNICKSYIYSEIGSPAERKEEKKGNRYVQFSYNIDVPVDAMRTYIPRTKPGENEQSNQTLLSFPYDPAAMKVGFNGDEILPNSTAGISASRSPISCIIRIWPPSSLAIN